MRRLLIVGWLLTVAIARIAVATTENESACFELIGFTNDGEYALAKWKTDPGTTSAVSLSKILIYKLSDGQRVYALTVWANEEAAVCADEEEAEAIQQRVRREKQQWLQFKREHGGVTRGIKLKLQKEALRGIVAGKQVEIRAEVSPDCKRYGGRVVVSIVAKIGDHKRKVFEDEAECGLYEDFQDYRKGNRIWSPTDLGAGRMTPDGRYALIMLGGRPFVVRLLASKLDCRAVGRFRIGYLAVFESSALAPLEHYG